MSGAAQGPVEGESRTAFVVKGLNLISHNTELLIYIALGLAGTLAESAGYAPFMRLADLVPPLPLPELGDHNTEINRTVLDSMGLNESAWTEGQKKSDLRDFPIIYRLSEWVDTITLSNVGFSVYISFATHILLVYPVIKDHHRVMLAVWLIVSLFRSVLRELVFSLLGIMLCSSHHVFFFPCVQYSALQGAQFCFIFYFWTSVNCFYDFIEKKNSPEVGRSIFNSIRQNCNFFESQLPSEPMEQPVEQVFSVDLDEDDDNTEAVLVYRAAMAWIVREILENDEEEYMTERELSQYLVVKATMEYRQALKELAEKKKYMRKTRDELSPKKKVKQSLEYMRLSTSHASNWLQDSSIAEKFHTNQIRLSIIPLIAQNSSSDNLSEVSRVSEDKEAQTEPPTHRMSKLLDMLEYYQQQ